MIRVLALAPGWVWLLVFVALPAALLAAIALATSIDAVPPFAFGVSIDNIASVAADPYYLASFFASLKIALVSAALCLAIGYPMALAIARAPARRQTFFLMLVMLPFWTGFLLRVAAWIAFLRDDGFLNAALMALHVAGAPFPMLHTRAAMYVGIVHAYLPFMVLPLHARLSRLDPLLEQAAADLGASPLEIFRRVTLPLSLPGVLAGCVLVFVPVTGEYVIPELLGAADSQTMGRVIWDTFFQERDWPMASALALVLLALLMIPALALRRGGR